MPQPSSHLPVEAAQRIDSLCDDFESAWKAGRSPQIEDLLSSATSEDRATGFAALLRVELELRRKAGQIVEIDPYLQRFPDLLEQIHSVFAECQAVVDTSVSKTPETLASQDVLCGPLHPDEPIPAVIGRFEVLGKIGEGAFGVVLRARDPQLEREVAIKLPRRGALQPGEIERFLREAKAAANMHHPNICPVYEVGTADGRPYIVMSLVPGKSLAEHLKQAKEPMPVRQAVLIVRKLAQALDLAHSKGIVHRDLKPANIMLDRERKDIVIMDFGLARYERYDDVGLTVSGMVLGTPAYMSPEQARGDQKAIGPVSDIYGLGVILHELLTKQRPFDGSMAEVLGKILHVEAPGPMAMRPDVGSQLDAIVRKCMAKDPRDRYGSMRELAGALTTFLKDKSASEKASVAAETRSDDMFATAAVSPPSEEGAAGPIAAKITPVSAAFGASRNTKGAWRVLTLLFAAALVLLGIMFFARTKTEEVFFHLKAVDPTDATLSFVLDGKPIAAADLVKPRELTVGAHEFEVKRDKEVLHKYTFKVSANAGPRIELGEEPVTRKAGWKPIFNERDLGDWEATDREESFSVDNEGNLAVAGDTPRILSWLLTKEEYSDFRLRLEFHFGGGAGTHKSGIAFRALPGRSDTNGSKLKIALNDAKGEKQALGAIVMTADDTIEPDCAATLKPESEWNTLELEARGPQVRVWINGDLVNEADLSKVDRSGFGPKKAFAQLDLDRTKGRIGIQNHKGKVKFRRLEIKQLDQRSDETDRAVAEWVLNTGGIVRVAVEEAVPNTLDEYMATPVLRRVDELPADAFHLTGFDLPAQAATDENLARFRDCKHLKLAWIYGDNITDAGMEEIGRHTELVALDVGGKEISDVGLTQLTKLTLLEELMIFNTQATSAGLKPLALLKRLRYVNLDSLPSAAVTDVTLSDLAQLPKLQSLVAAPAVNVTDEGLAHLSAAKLLEAVILRSPQVGDEGLSHLCKLLQLKSLVITAGEASDAGLANIGKLKKLQKLHLVVPGLSDDGVKKLAELPALENLWIESPRVTDAALEAIGKVEGLRFLTLHGTSITGKRLGSLRELPQLAELRIVDTPLSDESLSELNPKLTTLVLSNTNVTDRGLERLHSLPNLREANIAGARFTQVGIEALRKALPEANIVWPQYVAVDQDRVVAEQALGRGAKLRLAISGRELQWQPGETLPKESFRVRWINYQGGTNADLLQLAGLTELRLLHVGQDVDDEGIAALAKVASLEYLNVAGSKVSGAGLAHLKDLPKLQGLAMTGEQGAPENIKHISELVNLKSLEIDGRGINDESLFHLRKLVNLETLDMVNSSNVTGRGCVHLKDLPKLRFIDFRGNHHDDEALAAIGQLKSLANVPWGNMSEVTDKGLEALTGATALKNVNLIRSKITANGLRHLSAFKDLEELLLMETDIGDNATEQLLKLPKLKTLNIKGARFTPEGIKRLQDGLPNCQVIP